MSRCLREKSLLLLRTESGDRAQRLHLEGCQFCGGRYRRITKELELITSTLQNEPPLEAQTSPTIPFLYRSAPVVTAVLFAVALIWGEGRFLHTNFPKSSEQLASSDWSQLLEQASAALFPAEALGQTDVTSAGSDWDSFENALGESCAECQELFSYLRTEPSPTSERLNDQ